MLLRPHLPFLGAFLALGALAGWAIVPSQVGPPRARDDPSLVVRLSGEPFPADPDAARAAARRWLDERVTLEVPGGRTTRTREDLGARVDFTRLAQLARAAGDPTSALRRTHDARARGRPLDLPVPVAVDRGRVLAVVLALKDDADIAPVDARWDVVAGAARASRLGRRIDAGGALARLEAALVRGERSVTLPVEVVAPARTEAALAGLAAGALLGRYEVAVDPRLPRAADARAADAPTDGDREGTRGARVRMLAARIDGVVIVPGETLDVGAALAPLPREAIDGAASRVATAVHAAALLAGLAIAERHALPYLRLPAEAGLDAALALPGRTLRVRCSLGAMVVLAARVDAATLRVEVRGGSRTRAVTIEHAVEAIVPFAERTVTDARLPRGARLLAQRGVPGITLSRTRAVHTGDVVTRDTWHDSYAATPQIWRIGGGEPSPPGAAPPRRDPAPPPVSLDLVVARAGSVE